MTYHTNDLKFVNCKYLKRNAHQTGSLATTQNLIERSPTSIANASLN